MANMYCTSGMCSVAVQRNKMKRELKFFTHNMIAYMENLMVSTEKLELISEVRFAG